MANGRESPTGVAAAVDHRGHVRRKLTTMAYVELGHDNGGILLNLSEGGLAVQSALTLAGPEFPDLRFQLPNSKRWLMARGRITWMSESRTEAGIQFVDLRPETQLHIRRWIALAGDSSSSVSTQATSALDPRVAREPETQGRKFHPTPSVSAAAPMSIGIDQGSNIDHGFAFNDYSMFSTEPVSEQGIIEPRSNRWKSFALVSMCLAILFFVLGASFGRYTFDQWLQPQTPQRQTPTDPGATDAVNANASSSAAQPGSQNEQKSGQRPQLPVRNPENEAQSVSSAEQTSKEESDQSEPGANSDGRRQDQSEPANAVKPPPNFSANSGTAGVPASGTPEAANRKFRASHEHLQPLRPGPAMSPYRDARSRNDDDTHSILVSAPPPGTPAFFVNLSNEAVDASRWVAISAKRSVWIGTKASRDGFSSTERVTIGRLVSHTQPFYPEEARNQHLEGSVVLRARFGRTGTLLDVTPVSGPSALAAAAITALREWRYTPTYIDGEPVETQADVTMVFRLR